MVADTYSAFLGWLDQGTGNNNNTWGDNCDLSIFPIFEKAIAGQTARSITGGTTDLSAGGSNPPNAAHAMLEHFQVLTGTLVSTHTFIVANISKSWTFVNNTTGNFGVLIKTTSGTAVNIPQGKMTTIYCDGANVMYRNDKDQIGDLIFNGGAVKGGSFECTGGTKLIADYPDLAAKLGTTYGGNGTTTFGIPDAFTAGKFLRSRSSGQAFGVAQTNQNLAHDHGGATGAGGDHNHGGSTGAAGSHNHTGSTDSGGAHTHTIQWQLGNANGCCGLNTSYLGTTGSSSSTDSGGAHTHTFTTGTVSDHTHSISASGTHTHTIASNGGTEARPENIAGILCIKY